MVISVVKCSMTHTLFAWSWWLSWWGTNITNYGPQLRVKSRNNFLPHRITTVNKHRRRAVSRTQLADCPWRGVHQMFVAVVRTGRTRLYVFFLGHHEIMSFRATHFPEYRSFCGNNTHLNVECSLRIRSASLGRTLKKCKDVYHEAYGQIWQENEKYSEVYYSVDSLDWSEKGFYYYYLLEDTSTWVKNHVS